MWSSGDGDLRKRRDAAKPAEPAIGGRVKVRRETAGRRGKAVTTVSDVPLDDEALRVALLLLAWPPAEALDQAAVDQRCERRSEGLEVGERMQALRTLPELARRLRAAQHQHGEDRLLRRGEPERLVEQVTELRCATALRAGEARVAGAPEAGEGLTDGRLVVVDDRVAIGGLVAGQAQRVEAQRIGIRGRALLLEQGPQDPHLDVAQVHRPSVNGR